MTSAENWPPVCNTGASGLGGLRWDWYGATILELQDPSLVQFWLASCGPPGARWEPVRGLYGYPVASELTGLENGSLRVLSGAGKDVYVQATGAAAELVAPVLRERWPAHSVSRADVALDFDEPGAFDRLWRRVHQLAGENPRAKVRTSTAGDWIDGIHGRTLYAGGTTSRLRVVVYEKGLEQLGKDPGCGASEDWVRVEWRLRPSSDQKRWLAGASKLEALGLSAFGATVAGDLIGSDVVPVGNLLRFASADPAYWMARQYRRVLLGLVDLEPVELKRELVALLDAAVAG